MLSLVTGNLLDDEADVLVNPVNTVGVMGKGLALQFKREFPDNYLAYREACQRGELRPGTVFATKIDGDRWIVNFPTKRHWRQASRIADIASGLDALTRYLARSPATSIAIPPLGCGHGGLAWPEVRDLITDKLGNSDIAIRLYQPSTDPHQPKARC